MTWQISKSMIFKKQFVALFIALLYKDTLHVSVQQKPSGLKLNPNQKWRDDQLLS